MKYQVLARRYRPRRFEEVVGQESAAETLRGAILQDRVAHAYLFTGPRGVGKTSMARIFAKALNCPRAADRTGEKSLWGQPCDACSACEAIHAGQDIDVVELDGASHRGIEDVRSILEGVNRPATRSIFKIYIIDEVHMLTREAFNALLKTLEEPPAHVKFIFATTEPHRIPETVLSRCQRFDFHPIGEEAIVRRLSQILASEGRSAEEGLLEKVARCGKGGLRDAQTVLDQLMTFSSGALRLEDLERVTGRVPESTLAELASGTVRGEPSTVLARLTECFASGADPAILLEQVIENFRARIHALVTGSPVRGPEGGGEKQGPALDRLIGSLQILLDASAKLKYSPFAEVSVEVVLLKLARLEDPLALEDVLRALSEVETKEAAKSADFNSVASSVANSLARGLAHPPSPARPPSRGPVQADLLDAAGGPEGVAADGVAADRVGIRGETGTGPQPTRSRSVEPVEPSVGAGDPDFRHLLSVWDQIRVELDAKHPDMAPYFKDLTPAPVPGNPGVFLIEFKNDFSLRQMKSGRKQDAFLEVVREVARAPWKLQMDKTGSGQMPARTPSGIRLGGSLKAPASLSTPHAGDAAAGSAPTSRDAQPASGLQEGIARSALVKKSIDLFKGRLV
jgi:DNA polymerase-3 subunit gamma/tau